MKTNEWLTNEIIKLKRTPRYITTAQLVFLSLFTLCLLGTTILFCRDDFKHNLVLDEGRQIWICGSCGFRNYEGIERCGMCGTMRD